MAYSSGDAGSQGNGPDATMSMGSNGVISGPNGGGSMGNDKGPATAKPESKGNLARTISPLTPMSQDEGTDAWPDAEDMRDNDANEITSTGPGGSGSVAPLKPFSQGPSGTSVTNGR